MGEDDGGNVGVVEFRVGELGATEEAIGQFAAGGDGDGGELDFAADVAEGEDGVDVGGLVVVRDDLAAGVLLDAGDGEAEVFDFGGAADGPEEAVEVDGGRAGGVLVVHADPAVFAGDLFDAGLGGLAVEVDADALVLGGDFCLDHGVEGAEETVVADEQVGFAAEGVEHARHFDGDVAGADQGDFLRLPFQLEEAVGRDAEIATGNLLGDGGVAAGCEEDAFGADGRFAAVVEDHFGFGLGEEMGAAVDVLDFVILEVFFVDAVEAFDVGVPLVLEGLPVKGGGLVDGESVCAGFVDGVGDGSCIPGDFLGDAAGLFRQWRVL